MQHTPPSFNYTTDQHRPHKRIDDSRFTWAAFMTTFCWPGLGAVAKTGFLCSMPALGRDSCHNVRPVFRKPGHGLRPVDDTLVGVPGGIFQGFWLKSLRRILNEIMQAFVSTSALEGFCDGRTGPPTLGQFYDPRSVSLAEPRCGIELKTEDTIGGMASSVDHWILPFAG